MATAPSRGLPLFIALLIAAAFIIACAPATPSTPGVQVDDTFEPAAPFDPDRQLDAIQFRTEAEFSAFLRSSGEGYSGPYAYAQRDSLMALDAAVGAPAPAKASAESVTASAGGAGADYSGTNNQVAGVDEADILKTDGEYVYTTTGRTLFLIRAYPSADAAVLGTVDLDVDPSGLFVDGDKLAVIGNYYDTDYFAEVGIRPRNGFTRVTIYDVSDRSSPEVLETYTLEGSYQGARMKDGIIYLVLASGPDYRDEHPTPLIIRNDAVSSVPVRDAYWYPMPYQYIQFSTTHAIGLRDTDRAIESVTIAVEGQGTLYMSEDAIYLAATEWINEWELRQEIVRDTVEQKLSAQDRAIIKKIEATDSDVLSEAEKRSKIDQVYNEYVQYLPSKEQEALNEQVDEALKERLDALEAMEWTVINRIDVADDGSLAVGPTGKVPGSIYGQFALDEHDGYLRVATTVNQRFRWWGRPVPMMEAGVAVRTVDSAAEPAVDDAPSAKMIAPTELVAPQEQSSLNNVYVLDDDLEVVGKVTGIAPGESIFSARFMGDRLYLVTFRQVDPFFVIDLSDPTEPEIMGELKIPGFSRYLHPYDADTIIGIGRDATATGRQQGLKISLFDVSNIAKPKELASWVSDEEYAQSTAEYEHKAFLFDREKELLVIPAYGQDWQGNSRQSYNGAMVFRITPTSVKLRGIIDHGTNQQWYGATVERSFYIEDLLYTKSPTLLRINEIDDLSSVKKVRLEATNDKGPYPVY